MRPRHVAFVCRSICLVCSSLIWFSVPFAHLAASAMLPHLYRAQFSSVNGTRLPRSALMNFILPGAPAPQPAPAASPAVSTAWLVAVVVLGATTAAALVYILRLRAELKAVARSQGGLLSGESQFGRM